MQHLDETTFKSFISGSRVLVDFWATWCGPCRMQGRVLDELDAELGDRIGKLDVDAGGDIAAEYGVSSIPTLIVFENGQEVDRMVGLQSADTIRRALRA